MKEKGFLSHFLIIGTGTIINMIIGLITTPIITRIVDPVELGQLSIFGTYGSIALMVLCLGLDQAFIRFYYDHDDLPYKQSLLSFCVGVPLLFGVVSGILFFIIISTGIISFEFDRKTSILLILYVLLLIWDRLTLLLLRVTYRSKLYAACSIAQKAVYVGAVLLWALLIKKDYLLGLCLATILSIFTPSLIGTITTREMWRVRTSDSIDYRQIIKYALPLIVAMGLSQLFEAIDRLSLNHYRTYAEVGIYSSATSMVSVFAIIQTTFNTLWAPMHIDHYTKAPDDKAFFQRANQLITLAMFFLGIHLILFKDIFALLLGEKYRAAAHIIPFLVFHPIMYTVSETTHIGIGFVKKSYLNLVIIAVSCAANYIGNTILVPRFGCQGAAISTGCSYIVFFALRTAFSNRYYYVDYKLPKLAVITVLTIAFAFQNTFFEFNVYTIILYLACLGALILLYRTQMKEGIGMVIDFVKKKGDNNP